MSGLLYETCPLFQRRCLRYTEAPLEKRTKNRQLPVCGRKGRGMAKKKKKGNNRRGPAKKQTLIRLSQCMIVKNEESNIRQALSWGKGLVYEQIVVDTGSSDHTVQLATELGATVYTYPWEGDFAAAKNFAIEKARGNWIAFLDADEWFPPEEAKKVIPLLEAVHSDRGIDVLRTKISNVEHDGRVLSVACQDRLFRNDSAVRYRNRIHEALFRREGRALEVMDAQNQLMILHSGYAGSELRKQKGERNIRLLEEELEKRPYDGMCWAYLGDAYKSMENWEKALFCYRRILEEPKMEMTHEIAPLRAGLEIMSLLVNDPVEGIQEDYEQVSRRLKELGQDGHPDIDYFLGCMHLKAGKLKAAADYYESALKKLAQYQGIEISRITSELELVNRVIATAALLHGNSRKAVTFAVEALKVNRYSTDGAGILLRAFRTEWQEGMSAEPYWQFLSKLYDMQNLKDLLFVYKLSAEAGFTALQQEIWEHMPIQVRQQLGMPS